jgi:hypothetical protein
MKVFFTAFDRVGWIAVDKWNFSLPKEAEAVWGRPETNIRSK